MEILVAILVVIAVAAVVFAFMQRRHTGAPGRGRPRTSPGSRRTRRAPRSDPMTAAVVEHAQVTDPAEVPAAEARLRAQAQQVAAGLQAEAQRDEHARSSEQPAGTDPAVDPRYDAR